MDNMGNLAISLLKQ